MAHLDELAIKATQNPDTMEELISSSEFFILKCAGEATGRYITKSDDEWSIALQAFCQASEKYSPEKGSFLSFARLVIKRRLIDFCRQNSKYAGEIFVSPDEFECRPNSDGESTPLRMEIAEKVAYIEDNWLKLEIESIGEVFSQYGFEFFELAACCPKAEKTKAACARTAAFIIKNNEILSEIKITKRLPIKEIHKNLKIPRKLLERHRKYIIAAVEIMTGDYPYLAEYMRFIREELAK